MVRTNYCSIRIMWIILVLIATGSSCYMVYRAINSYLQYEVTTQIRTIKEIPTTFPRVTICNINPLIKGKEALTNYLTGIKRLEFLNQTFLYQQYNFYSNKSRVSLRLIIFFDEELQTLHHMMKNLLNLHHLMKSFQFFIIFLFFLNMMKIYTNSSSFFF